MAKIERKEFELSVTVNNIHLVALYGKRFESDTVLNNSFLNKRVVIETER